VVQISPIALGQYVMRKCRQAYYADTCRLT
jgi:hypothetical protein